VSDTRTTEELRYAFISDLKAVWADDNLMCIEEYDRIIETYDTLTARSTDAEAMCDRLADKLAESGCPPVGEYACPVDDCGAEDYIRPACWLEWARR
jgi:hypothetical protein